MHIYSSNPTRPGTPIDWHGGETAICSQIRRLLRLPGAKSKNAASQAALLPRDIRRAA
jgi:hypothetical protein